MCSGLVHRPVGPKIHWRMPPEYMAALKLFAFQDGVSLLEYVRELFHDHILQRGGRFQRKRGRFESS
jgi:hypothetical protein